MKKELHSILMVATIMLSTFMIFFQGSTRVQLNGTSANGYQGIAPAPNANDDLVVTLDGTNQTVRYIANRSLQLPDTEANGSILIPAISDDSRLMATNNTFYFNQTPFYVNHTIEDDSGYEVPLAQSGFKGPTNISLSSLVVGTPVSGSAGNIVNTPSTWVISSVNNTIVLNTTHVFGIPYPDGFRNDFKLEYSTLDAGVSLQVMVLDHHYGQGWVPRLTPVPGLNNSGTFKSETFSCIDDHSRSLANINSTTSYMNVSWVFTASTNFTITFYSVQAQVSKTAEHLIQGANPMALSFDLRGDAIVQGFYLLLRSKNITSNETLNMYVCNSDTPNITLEQIQDEGNDALGEYQRPNVTSVVAGTSISIVNYSGDGVQLFNFSSPVAMPEGHYFLVINTSIPGGERYSLGMISMTRDPDKRLDHTLLWYSTGNWIKLYENAGFTGEYDAGPFHVLLKRGIKPTDLNITIGDVPMVDVGINATAPYSTSNREWGLGRWNIPAGTTFNATGSYYNLTMTWNASLANFTYNATMDLLVYANENATAACNLDLVSDPTWQLTYSYADDRYPGWAGKSINITFPSDWTVLNLTNPNGSNIFEVGNVQDAGGSLSMYSVDEASTTNGMYQVNLESTNFLDEIETFLKFGDNYYNVSNFQEGDALSARIHVQDSTSKPVYNGKVNITLLSSSGAKRFSAESSLIDNTLGSRTSYHFNDSVLYTFTSSISTGEHDVVTFWFNGSEAGIARKEITYVNYSIQEVHVTQDFDSGTNIVSGSFATGATSGVSTVIKVVTVNGTKSPLEISPEEGLGNLVIHEYTQNETVLNPGENLGITINVSSNDTILKHEIDARVEIFQESHPDRVIMNLTLVGGPVEIDALGFENNSRLLSFQGTVPSNASGGYNAPVRSTTYQSRVVLTIDGYDSHSWTSNKTISVVSWNATDGTVMLVNASSPKLGLSFSRRVDRLNGTLFNVPTTYFVLLESEDGTCLAQPFIYMYQNNVSTAFEDVKVTPVTDHILARNNDVMITGYIRMENGENLGSAVNISMAYNTTSGWVPLAFHESNSATLTTASNGSFSGTFTIPSNLSTTQMVLRISWDGDASNKINPSSTTIPLPLLNLVPNILIELVGEDKVEVFGDTKNFYTFQFTNTGNTTILLRNAPRLESPEGILSASKVVGWDSTGKIIKPGESVKCQFNLLTPEPGIGKTIDTNFTVKISARSLETNEDLEPGQTFEATIKSVNLIQRIAAVWYVPFIALIAILAWLVFMFARRVEKQARKPVAEGKLAKEKRKRGPAAKPVIIKKGAELKRELDASKAGKKEEKGYRDIDEVIDEISDEVSETGEDEKEK